MFGPKCNFSCKDTLFFMMHDNFSLKIGIFAKNWIMDVFYNRFKSYSILAICYFAAVFVVKLLEIALHFSAVASFGGFVYGNLVACGFVVSLVCVVWLVVSLLSKNAALYVSAVLLGIMMLTEVGLAMYYDTTGILMGKELITRPLWEMVHTVQSAVSIWMIAGVVLALCIYVFVSVRLAKRNIRKFTVCLTALVAIVSIPLFFVVGTNQDKVVVNKTMYCIRECMKRTEVDLGLTKTDYDSRIVENYLKMFPDREVIDSQYPLERKDNIENVLGPYFRQSETKPNVVVIIVESLGYDLLRYTPFIDSLSQHSLFWDNCMATTPRSFGAVPAITGSVPHGLKGFQFGNIPSHNSIIAILAQNGYSTNAFYAGNFSFDRIYDYLLSQQIDYMSPFYDEYRADKSEHKDGTYWGYHDDVMFKKSMEIIEKRDDTKPSFDIFVTISQHEDLQLVDKDLQKRYYDIARELGASQTMLGKLASTVYTDDAIRHFMKRYSEYDKDGNTIFVITGDHSMNINGKNPLDSYHVPLVIYSPLLTSHKSFDAMVSHNDITPSLLALLRDNFGVKTPETVSWVSDGLDTVAGFHSNIRNYFLHYCRELKDFVWNDNYYTTADKNRPVARIVEGVDVEYIDNPHVAGDLAEKFKTMVYVDNYVYSNNRIVKNPILGTDKFTVIYSKTVPDTIFSASNKEKPSLVPPVITMIYNNKFKKDCSEIKFVMTADMKYTGRVWQDAFINLVVDCVGNNMETVYSSDYISKYIMERSPEANKWQKLEVTKIISTNHSDKFELKVYLLPTHKDELWNPEHTVTLKNVKITIFKNE